MVLCAVKNPAVFFFLRKTEDWNLEQKKGGGTILVGTWKDSSTKSNAVCWGPAHEVPQGGKDYMTHGARDHSYFILAHYLTIIIPVSYEFIWGSILVRETNFSVGKVSRTNNDSDCYNVGQ